MIIAVGFKVNSEKAVQFRKWVNQIAKEYTIKGWVMDPEKEHMGLTTWADAPDGKIKKSDVVIAKIYLTDVELGQLERMVTAYLDFAETMTLRRILLQCQKTLASHSWQEKRSARQKVFQYTLDAINERKYSVERWVDEGSI